jgi:hypothetical protein
MKEREKKGITLREGWRSKSTVKSLRSVGFRDGFERGGERNRRLFFLASGTEWGGVGRGLPRDRLCPRV